LDFSNFIIEAQPASLLDAQFLLEFYRRYYLVETSFRKKSSSALEALQEIHFKSNTLMDGLLPMRLGFKSGSLWRSYLETRIGDELLHELIKERSPLGWTTPPRLPPALNLWEYLNQVAGD